MSIHLHSARPEHRPALQALLSSLQLPTEDLPDDLSGFTLVFDDQELVGSAGLQSVGPFGLLRSVAVRPAYRSQGLGEKAYAAAVEYARQQQIQEIWLITTTADRYFEKLGFARIQRDSVPADIAATSQFSALCPSSAIVMHKVL